MPSQTQSLIRPWAVALLYLQLLLPLHAAWETVDGFHGDDIALDGLTLPYRYFVPEEQGAALPLVVYLHGLGQRGDDNTKQLSAQATIWSEPWMQQKYPCYVLAPQTRDKHFWIDQDGENAIRHVYQAIEELAQRYSIDRKRIYLTGNSMGGCGAWGAIWHRPNYFAAAIPVSGTVSGKPYIDPRVESDLLKLKGIPIWAWNCADDPVISPEGARAAYQLLQPHGMRYSELDHTEGSKPNPHGLPRAKAFTPNSLFPNETNWELYHWLFSQAR